MISTLRELITHLKSLHFYYAFRMQKILVLFSKFVTENNRLTDRLLDIFEKTDRSKFL